MKKFLAIILALVMALSLVACGGTPAQQPDSGNDANVEANDGANTDADVKAPVVTDGAVLGEGAHSFTLEITDADGKTITGHRQFGRKDAGRRPRQAERHSGRERTVYDGQRRYL